MFPEMRRKGQSLTEAECAAVLREGSGGVLALLGDGGYPYAVPLNYLYDGGKLYFHCARSGHKLDAARREPRASFCVVDRDEVIPEEYATNYRSVIVFGRLRELTEETEKRAVIEKLALRFHPTGSEEGRRKEIEEFFPALCLLELTPEHITGKEGRRLAEERRKQNG